MMVGIEMKVLVSMSRFAEDGSREVRMDEEVKVREESILRVLDGVLEVGGKGVEVGEEGLCVG